MPIRVPLPRPAVPLDVLPQHTHVLPRSIPRHEAPPTPAGRVVHQPHQVAHSCPAAFDPIVGRGVPLQHLASATPPLSPTVSLAHVPQPHLPLPLTHHPFTQW